MVDFVIISIAIAIVVAVLLRYVLKWRKGISGCSACGGSCPYGRNCKSLD